MPVCPVCRSVPPLGGGARRCFVEAECPVCLTTVAPLYVLACGHAVCQDDLQKLGLGVETNATGRHLLEGFRRAVSLCLALVHMCVIVGSIYFATVDPGAPLQACYSLSLLLFTGGDTEICVDRCFGTVELITHTCNSHCDCTGERVCTVAGYCAGDAGECSAQGHGGWRLSPSVTLTANHTASWEYRLNSTNFNPVSSSNSGGGARNGTLWIGRWSPAFAVGGVPNLALQLRLFQPEQPQTGTDRHACQPYL